MVNESNYPERIAFVVGAVTGNELRAGKRDVSQVFTLLTEPHLGGCDFKQSKIIPECRKEDFELSISELLKSWNSSTQLIFYFSGHGEMIQNKYCFKFDEQKYAFENLLTDLKIYKVNRAIIILDSCYSGGAMDNGTKSNGDSRFIKDDHIPEGIALIASSKKTQESYELKDDLQGVFTHLFCQGIKSGLNNKLTDKGLITIPEIVTYINNKLSQEDYSSFTQKALYHINKSDQNIWITKNITNKTKKESNRYIQKYLHKEYLYLDSDYKRLKALSSKQLRLLVFDKEIYIKQLKRHIKQLENWLDTIINTPATNIENYNNQGNTNMSEKMGDKIYIRENYGPVGKEGKIHGAVGNKGEIYGLAGSKGKIQDSNIARTINEDKQKTLAETAAEIQQLLKQLEQSNPTETTAGKMAVVAQAIEIVENQPTLKQRVIGLLKSVGTEGFKEALNNPFANLLVAAFQGWIEP
ncbi:MAG: caspase family protein [Okeania sp. SIO3B5]|uniref:caspase family protein n=1 Tax=Okeania sp. SIO3B5 TaxID=2607811 RepID=UPI0013FE7587|nr:caspase family protein [Okeania sp. SIO3B5]NEO51942.1 caspase family protein [Okeania sp. SIO3B5]